MFIYESAKKREIDSMNYMIAVVILLALNSTWENSESDHNNFCGLIYDCLILFDEIDSISLV